MSWKPMWTSCGGEKTFSVPSHPIITAGEAGGNIKCLICSYAEEVADLEHRISQAAALLREGKVVQAHEVLHRSGEARKP